MNVLSYTQYMLGQSSNLFSEAFVQFFHARFERARKKSSTSYVFFRNAFRKSLVLDALLLYGLIATVAILSSALIIYAMRNRGKTAKKPSEKDQPKKPLNPRALTRTSLKLI